MPRTNYATPLDVIRKVDPTVGRDDLRNDDITGVDDNEVITSRIEGAEADFETTTGHSFRDTTEGAGPRSYRFLRARGTRFPVKLYTDHTPVVPLDASEGDALELRTGRNTWDDVTGREGDLWTADYHTGRFKVYRMPGYGRMPMLHDYRDRFARIRYRHGALGGDPAYGGQTTITSQLATGDTPTVGVGDAARLPQGEYVMLLGGSEYVLVTDVDETNDQVTIGARGLRLTKDVDHPAGTVLHYCPMNVREAVAARAAHELIRFDDKVALLKDTTDAVSPTDKLEHLDDEWTRAVNRYMGMGYE